MYIDKKVTAWRRFFVPDTLSLKDVIDLSYDDLLDSQVITTQPISVEDSQEMSVQNNLGCSTTVIFDNKGNELFANGK